MYFPSDVHSFCKRQRFLFCLSPYLFSKWHIVPQLCVQLKQSRVYSRKALAECKASRRLGKQIRGLSRFLSIAHPAAVSSSNAHAIKPKKADAQDSSSCTSAFAYTHSMKLLLHSVYFIILLSSFYYWRILPVIVHIKPC